AGYIINWQVNSLPHASETYAYFTLLNVIQQALLSHVTNVMGVPSTVSPSNIIKVIGISVPTFYVNETGSINLTAFYTGTSSQGVNVSLTAPVGYTVRNSSQYFNVTPNSAFIKRFEVIPDSTGTMLLELYISTHGASLSYSIPALVLAKPIVTTTPTTTVPQTAINAITKSAPYYATIALIILLIIIVIVIISRVASKPKYNSDRAEKLKQLRETMKRGQ
ncbi:MAG: hypothetical protein QXR73_03130, partial [Candidatus Micrarchaeaceae archaeon]